MPWAVLDASVYLDHWERGRNEKELADVRSAFVIRHSAVVLSELRRGTSTNAGRRWVAELARAATAIWAPAAADWWDAGRLIQQFGNARHWNTSKRRDFQNDALIALTAKRHGATVVTADRADFELLGSALHIQVRFV